MVTSEHSVPSHATLSVRLCCFHGFLYLLHSYLSGYFHLMHHLTLQMTILAIVPGISKVCLQENLVDCADCGGLGLKSLGFKSKDKVCVQKMLGLKWFFAQKIWSGKILTVIDPKSFGVQKSCGTQTRHPLFYLIDTKKVLSSCRHPSDTFQTNSVDTPVTNKTPWRISDQQQIR